MDKFTIIKGVDNEYTFTVKANNSLLPMPIATGSNTVVATTITEYPAADYVPSVTGTDAQLWKTRVYTDVSTLYSRPTYYGSSVLPLDTDFSSTIVVDLNLGAYRGLVRNDTPGPFSHGVKVVDGIVYDITATTGTTTLTTTYDWGAAKTLSLTVDGVTTAGVNINLNSTDDQLLSSVAAQLSLGGNYVVNIHDSKLYISKKVTGGLVLSVTGSQELSITKGTFPGAVSVHYIAVNYLWINGNITKEWNGTAWVVPTVSVVVDGVTRSVNFDYTAHSNKNTLLQALKTQMAIDTSLVLTVEDDYIEVHKSVNFAVVEGTYTKSRVTQVGTSIVSGSAGGYRIRLSTHTVDTSILNRMTIPTDKVTLTTTLGSVVGLVSKTNGVFPSTITLTDLNTSTYSTLPPQAVVTCSYAYTGTDEFKFTLRPLTNTSTVVRTWVLDAGVSIVDSINGKIKLIVSAEDTLADGLKGTTELVSLKGDIVHGGYLKPVYELRLEAGTQYNGNFVAIVGKVYVHS